MKKQGKVFRNKTFTRETIDLDGNTYDNCTFDNCKLVYRGTGEVKFLNDCSITTPVLTFDGAAGRTLGFLKALYPSGFRPIIERVINTIRGVETPPRKEEVGH
jgi:hypothetical protein